MNIASLSEKIIIEKNTPVVDENANHRNHWEEYFSCWTYAGASSYQQSEQEKAGVTIAEDGLVFTVRYCSELAGLDATHYRIRFQGDTYNITSVDMMNYNHKNIKISCEKERKDNGV